MSACSSVYQLSTYTSLHTVGCSNVREVVNAPGGWALLAVASSADAVGIESITRPLLGNSLRCIVENER